MPDPVWFEKRIIEKLIEKSKFKSFEVGDKIEFFKKFGIYKQDPNLSKAFDNLVERKMLW